MMKNIVFRFCHDETGAVTVDWVVLSAAIIGIGMLVLTPIAYTTDSSASKIAANIADQDVGYGSNP
jgi:Flp pilus assembly pilin Flp